MFPRSLVLAVAVCSSLAVPAYASLEDAAAAYRRGAALERNGASDSALVEYQAALAHDPQYFYAWRQIGNCWVRLRQPQKAVDAYDHYLLAKPTDLQVKDYADRLRKAYSLPQAGGATANDAGGLAQPQWYAGLAVQPVMLGANDINAMIPDGSTKASSSLGVGYGIEGGWRHPSGFYLAPGYRTKLPLSFPVMVGGHLGVGQAAITYESISEIGGGAGKSSVSVSQSTLLILAELRADTQVWKQLDLGLGLGWQSATLTKMDGSNGTLQDPQGNNAKADFSGLRASLSADWVF